MISYEKALDIAVEFAKEIDCRYPDRIKAVYAIGSLGSDYYRPGQSDIDTAIVTDFSRNEIDCVTEQIENIADGYQQKYQVPKGFGAIVFAQEQLFPPYVKEEELIQEILRLKTQSKLIYGHFDVNTIPMPDWNAIKEDILNFQEWIDEQPTFQHTRQSFINSTLIALKRYLLLKHHMIEFNKFKVIGLYMQNEPPMVNEEIFEFIQASLYERPVIWNDEICSQYVKWHDELYRVINKLVLYNEL